MSISIRPATAADAPFLPEIERSAGEAFLALPDLAWISSDTVEPVEAYLPRIAAGTVWVADDAQDGLVGSILCELTGDVLHVVELAVALGFQKRGIGRALLGAAVAFARGRGLRAVTLTTFRHVAWNGPFYARYGFVERTDAAMDAHLRAAVAAETARGLPNRCAMTMMLG